MAFLTQYRKLRGTNPCGLGEVEFNFGRAFHQLGEYSFPDHVRHGLYIYILYP